MKMMFLILTPLFLLTLTLSEAINFRNQIIPRPGAGWNINYRSDNPVYENTAALLPLASGFAGYRLRQDLSMPGNVFYNRGLYAPMQPEFSPFFYYKRAIMKWPEKHTEHSPRCLWSFWNSLGFGRSKEVSSKDEENLAQNKPQESQRVDKKPIANSPSYSSIPVSSIENPQEIIALESEESDHIKETNFSSTTLAPISTATTPIPTTTTPISTTTTPISTTTTPISTTTTPISTTTTPISTTTTPIPTTTTPISTTTTPISTTEAPLIVSTTVDSKA